MNIDIKRNIVTILNTYECLTTAEIARLVNKTFAQNMSSASIAGHLRFLVSRGFTASADNGNGKKVYWMTDFGKEYFK